MNSIIISGFMNYSCFGISSRHILLIYLVTWVFQIWLTCCTIPLFQVIPLRDVSLPQIFVYSYYFHCGVMCNRNFIFDGNWRQTNRPTEWPTINQLTDQPSQPTNQPTNQPTDRPTHPPTDWLDWPTDQPTTSIKQSPSWEAPFSLQEWKCSEAEVSEKYC